MKGLISIYREWQWNRAMPRWIDDADLSEWSPLVGRCIHGHRTEMFRFKEFIAEYPDPPKTQCWQCGEPVEWEAQG